MINTYVRIMLEQLLSLHAQANLYKGSEGHPTYLEGMKKWIPYLEQSLDDIKGELKVV